MDATTHPTKGLCTPNMQPIHKINYIKRRLTKACTIPVKQVFTIASLTCWRDFSSASKTLLFLSLQRVQKITCGINKIPFTFAFLPNHPPKPRDDPSLSQKQPKKSPSNCKLTPKEFQQNDSATKGDQTTPNPLCTQSIY